MSEVVYTIQVYFDEEYQYTLPEAYLNVESADEHAEEIRKHLNETSYLYEVVVDKLYLIE